MKKYYLFMTDNVRGDFTFDRLQSLLALGWEPYEQPVLGGSILLQWLVKVEDNSNNLLFWKGAIRSWLDTTESPTIPMDREDLETLYNDISQEVSK